MTQAAAHSRHCYQINMQKHFGGGEVYTGFLTRALLAAGWEVTLFRHPQADFWEQLDLGNATQIPVNDGTEIVSFLAEQAQQSGLVLYHGPPARSLQMPSGFCVIAIAHMPVYDRNADGFRKADHVLGVSQHVLDSLAAKQIEHVYPDPLYGVADLRAGKASEAITSQSRYDWDERKVRDKLLSHIHPWYQRLRRRRRFTADAPLTLGIVSRITPIKQFDQQFRVLAPILARHPEVRLEIFGSGGYASIRDLRKALAPIKRQVRWWGHQSNVQAIYAQLDYLLTGLPEKEALGLNVLEAQQVGLPVLAVDAPPFRETVIQGKSGYLYQDPRKDQGAGFEKLIGQLLQQHGHPDPRYISGHLQRFSFAAFSLRIGDIFEQLWAACRR